MSKVFKALEQARMDRTPSRAAVHTPRTAVPRSTPTPSSSGAAPHPGLSEAQPLLSAEQVDPRLVSLIDPVSPAAEQYRLLRQIVEQTQRAEKLSLFAVSSPSVGDGKTTTAINLAGALAQAPEANVLLIEADLRRPAIASRLPLARSTPGVVGLIKDPALTLGDAIHACPPFNLSVLPAGSAIATPYELLKSPRLGQLLEEARAQYDFVVLDTPPLVSIPDCRIIGRYVDKFLLVVAAHKTPTRLLDEALRILSPSKTLGLVFNGGQSIDTTYAYSNSYTDRLRVSPPNGGQPRRGGRLIDRLIFRGTTRESHEEAWP